MQLHDPDAGASAGLGGGYAKGGAIGYSKGGVVGDSKPRYKGIVHKGR
jgi:hypothetical protein